MKSVDVKPIVMTSTLCKNWSAECIKSRDDPDESCSPDSGLVACPSTGADSLGFTNAQRIMFQNSCENGSSVVLMNPEVARSLGVKSSGLVLNTDNDGDIIGHFDEDEDEGDEVAQPRRRRRDQHVRHRSSHSRRMRRNQRHSSDATTDSTAVSVSVSDSDVAVANLLDTDRFLETQLASGKASAVVDEKLTSLSWIQAQNGVNLSASTDMAVCSVQAGGLMDEESRDCRSAAPSSHVRASSKRPGSHTPYDPQVHTNFKPPFSFSSLIFMAIEDSPMKALPVKEIYNWIMRSFPFYNNRCVGWKNSVRHNLSLNKCFCKVDGGRCSGKGSLWSIEPQSRGSLVQTLRRSRCVIDEVAAGRQDVLDRRRMPWTSALSPHTDHSTASRPDIRQSVTTEVRRNCRTSEAHAPDALGLTESQCSRVISSSHSTDSQSRRHITALVPRRDKHDAESRPSRPHPPARHPPSRHGVRMFRGKSHNHPYRRGDCGRGEHVDQSQHDNMRQVVIRHYPSDEHTYAGSQQQHDDSHRYMNSHANTGLVYLAVDCDGAEQDEHDVTVTWHNNSQQQLSRRRSIGDDSDAVANVAHYCVANDSEEASRRLVEEGAGLLLNLAGMSRSQSPNIPSGSPSQHPH